LARQLIQDKFAQDFKGDTKTSAVEYEKVFEWLGTNQGIVATPHAQRSFARVKAEVEVDFDFVKLIDAVEDFLQTPVQGAVKREDEQEFALRNGQNLMFCEDAARRVKAGLEKITGVKDFIAEFDHVESLHPHSAVSRISKGQQLKDF
jgi:GTP cyclohydrolase I